MTAVYSWDETDFDIEQDSCKANLKKVSEQM